MKLRTVFLLVFITCYQLSAQDKMNLDGFTWETDTTNKNLVYGIGISVPGLPFELAQKQALKHAEVWIHASLSTTIDAQRFSLPGENLQDYGFDYSELYNQSIDLKIGLFDLKTEVEKTVQFEDGTVCIILKADISTGTSVVKNEFVALNYSALESTAGNNSFYSMSYSLVFNEEDYVLNAIRLDDKLKLFPNRTVSKNVPTKAKSVKAPEWYINPQKDSGNFLYASGISEFSQEAKIQIQLTDAVFVAYTQAYYQLASKIQTKVEVLKKAFEEDLDIKKEDSTDAFSMGIRTTIQNQLLNNSSFTRFAIENNVVYIELGLRIESVRESINDKLKRDQELYKKWKEAQNAEKNKH